MESTREHFSESDRIRYSRHFVLPGFGEASQVRLQQSAVLVVGAGGLGAPVLYYLTAAGVGTLGVADPDAVSLSNLQRQILFTTDDLGQNKAVQASARLRALNPTTQVVSIPIAVNTENALDLLAPYDLVVDATDNFPTRYLLNDACVLLGKPLIYGSVFRFEGQVSVFNYQDGPTYRDLYPVPPIPGSVPDCEQGGVLGVLPGIIGSIQANEAIKILTGIGEPLNGRLLLFDSLRMETQIVTLPKKQNHSIKNLIDYDQFCGHASNDQKAERMKEVTVQELKQWKDAGEDFQLIDVREPHEFDICHLDGELIPMAEIPHQVEQISKTKKVVLHCRSGSRSGNMVQWLEKNHGFTNLYNLKGGVLAWIDHIDPSLTKY
ncbi:MAG: molybdopterin-synthase adenylyltransferase MoeB [Cytophagales bacterium]|nr:molybdopterin-synthase adenylyltransferase MoeB [Cytophagales bacterium]